MSQKSIRVSFTVQQLTVINSALARYNTDNWAEQAIQTTAIKTVMKAIISTGHLPETPLPSIISNSVLPTTENVIPAIDPVIISAINTNDFLLLTLQQLDSIPMTVRSTWNEDTNAAYQDAYSIAFAASL
jgi:hypothetical protein